MSARRHLLLALLVGAGGFSSGCLGTSYRISQRELARVAALDPSTRGNHVRVVQNWSQSDPHRPPARQDVVEPVRVNTVNVGLASETYRSEAHAVYGEAQANDASGETVATVVAEARPGTQSPSVGGVVANARPRTDSVVDVVEAHPDVPPSEPRPTVEVRGGTSIPLQQVQVRPAARTPTNNTSTTESSESSNSNDDGDEASALIVVVAVVAAAAVGIVVGVTEATRFDGFAHLGANQRLILGGTGERPVEATLASLTPALAERASYADFYPDGDFQLREHGSLNRAGFVYSIDLGFGPVDLTNGVLDRGFTVSQGVGYFPIHQLGLLATFSLGQAEQRQSTDVRGGAELRFMPLNSSYVSLGLYANVGGSRLLGSPSPDELLSRTYYGGGLLTELTMSTRSALLLRVGLQNLTSDAGEALQLETSLGFSFF